MKKLGVIGVGKLDSAMIRRLNEAGYDVVEANTINGLHADEIIIDKMYNYGD